MGKELLRMELLSTYRDDWRAPASAVVRFGDTLYLSGFPPEAHGGLTQMDNVRTRRGMSRARGTKDGNTVPYRYKMIESPVGELKLVVSNKGLAAILWKNDDPRRVRLYPLVEDPDNPIVQETERQLGEYFAGRLKAFTVPLDFKGTEFQKRVWEALLTIPFGETRTYGEIARQLGHPTASRAVGAANGKNPIAIITPCHRVIGSTGKLTGFAGGLKAKAHLLGIEQTSCG
jgi:methylated-DNA-[protein]-cysteine S-methyltransferase